MASRSLGLLRNPTLILRRHRADARVLLRGLGMLGPFSIDTYFRFTGIAVVVQRRGYARTLSGICSASRSCPFFKRRISDSSWLDPCALGTLVFTLAVGWVLRSQRYARWSSFRAAGIRPVPASLVARPIRDSSARPQRVIAGTFTSRCAAVAPELRVSFLHAVGVIFWSIRIA